MEASESEEQLKLTAADVVGSNDDLLRMILIRSPAKSLVRFKLVSKRWRCIISEDREFAIEHSRRNSDSNAPCGIFLYGVEAPDTMSIPIFGGSVPSLSFLVQILQNNGFDHIQSCNGLLLCSFSEHDGQIHNAQTRYIVCNPTTRDFKVLPLFSIPPTERSNTIVFDYGEEFSYEIYPQYHGFTLVFNPSKSHHYKVAVIRSYSSLYGSPMHRAGVNSELHIYSSETNSWEFKRHFDVDMEGVGLGGVYPNDDNKIYWLVNEESMLYYDLNSEDFGYINVPGEISYQGPQLTQSGGRLYMAALFECDDSDKTRSLIFEFESSSMRWLDPTVELLDNVSEESVVLFGVIKGANEMELLVLHLTNTKLIFTDMVLHRTFEVHGLRSDRIYNVFEYIPSLAPV